LAGSESESDVRPTDGGRSRIHITGGSGAGKSSLARSIGARFGLPVYHLDDVPRDRGSGRVRALDERLEIVQSIATSSAWVTEGVHAEWTDELVRRADLIIWLDQLEGRTALLRVFRRFVGDGLAEARRRRGLQRFTRIRSYVYQLGQFIRFVGEVQAFHGDGARAKAAEGGSRAATIAQLQPYSAKVIHCRTQADVDNVTAAYGTSRSGSRSPGARGRPGFIARVTTFRRQYPRGGALFFTRRVNRTAGAALAVLLFSTRVSPNAVSVAGLIVHFVTAVLVATASSPIPPPTWIVVLLLWQLAFSLDCADGQLARARGTATPFGAWLDIFFDVITHVMVYGALVVYVVRALDIEGVEASALTTSVMGAHLFQAFTSWERGVIGTAPAIAEPHGLFAVAMHARHLLDYGWFLFAAAILLPFPYLLVGFLIFSAAIHALSAIAQLALNWRYQVVADESPPR
jgi:phosphatidylglycerophosphate synthase